MTIEPSTRSESVVTTMPHAETPDAAARLSVGKCRFESNLVEEIHIVIAVNVANIVITAVFAGPVCLLVMRRFSL